MSIRIPSRVADHLIWSARRLGNVDVSRDGWRVFGYVEGSTAREELYRLNCSRKHRQFEVIGSVAQLRLFHRHVVALTAAAPPSLRGWMERTESHVESKLILAGGTT